MIYIKKFAVLIAAVSAWLLSLTLSQVNEWLQFAVLSSGLLYTFWKWFFRKPKTDK